MPARLVDDLPAACDGILVLTCDRGAKALVPDASKSVMSDKDLMEDIIA
jgi:hypothetical protein